MIPDFLEELSRIVGATYVCSDQLTLQYYARSTAPDGTQPLAIVKPANREQVQRIVRLAARYKAPVFPISLGKNWGYGDACAPHAGSVIVDLSRMNRIWEVNLDLAFAVIEPGVSQGQLLDYIRQHRLPLMMDATAAGRDASVVGNILERGSGHTPYGNRFAMSCDYEVVLPDGSTIETGFGAYRNSQAKHIFKQGIGPAIDGLFSQSNLGIVTRMTVWLMPEPEKLCMFFVMLERADSVGPFFETIRRLRLTGTIRSALHCFNDRRILSGALRYPWNLADGRRALEVEFPDLFRELCHTYCITPWAATGSLQGTVTEVAAARKIVKRALSSTSGVMGIVFLQDSSSADIPRSMQCCWRKKLPNWVKAPAVEQFRVGWDLLRGLPSDQVLMSSLWRCRTTIEKSSLNPLDNGAGLVWVSPILPMTAAAVMEVIRLSEGVVHKYGFEYQATITAITDRAVVAVQNISFDKSNVEEIARARQCQDELLKELLDRGYVPYRGSLSTMQQVWRYAPSYWKAVSSLKCAWDPDGVIAPDRYIPGLE